MVSARLLPAPACLNREEDTGALTQQGLTMNTGRNQPQDTATDEPGDSRLYRSLARSYTEELQRQEMRKKRATSVAFVICTIFFLGLIILTYWSRG